jgi:hypothetical protein
VTKLYSGISLVKKLHQGPATAPADPARRRVLALMVFDTERVLAQAGQQWPQ